jgi:tetratricopeptide (TPR) repeat protein
MLAAAGKADLGSLLRELQTTPVDDIRDDLEGLNPELEQAQALVEADPGNPEAHLQLASAYEAAGMMPESTREYARAGEIFLNEDRIFESAKAISEAFRIQGVPLRADENLINLATRVLFLAAPLENSLDIFHLVSQHVPRWDRLKILEARRLIFAGELERADAILGEALEQNPGDVYAQTISAEWNQAKGLNERAGRIVERLLEESDLLPDWLREHLLHFQASVAP